MHVRVGLAEIPPALSISKKVKPENSKGSRSIRKPTSVREILLIRVWFANRMTLPEFEDLDWHVIPPYEVYERLSTSPQQGLSSDQVARKLKEYGPNMPSAPPSRWLRKTLGYLFGGFGPILFVASILVFVAWKPLGEPNPAIANLALGIVLAIVFFAQALFAFVQGEYFLSIRTPVTIAHLEADWSSSRVMASITSMLPDQCTVLRDGKSQTVVGTQIVPGDVLFLKMGDKVPADVRFVDVSTDAKFDRSILTGMPEAPFLRRVGYDLTVKSRRIFASARYS
jgi:sodium/potassium-transporting ATPase subunit alpha